MSSPTIQVRVLLFAAYREAVGKRELALEVEANATVEDLFRRLADEYPALGELRGCTAFAVNREISDPGTRLESGDDVAFLQPLSGG